MPTSSVYSIVSTFRSYFLASLISSQSSTPKTPTFFGVLLEPGEFDLLTSCRSLTFRKLYYIVSIQYIFDVSDLFLASLISSQSSTRKTSTFFSSSPRTWGIWSINKLKSPTFRRLCLHLHQPNLFTLQATTDLYGKCTTTHSGTSAAAPEAAGVFALALEAK
jgi:hypothetical protein